MSSTCNAELVLPIQIGKAYFTNRHTKTLYAVTLSGIPNILTLRHYLKSPLAKDVTFPDHFKLDIKVTPSSLILLILDNLNPQKLNAVLQKTNSHLDRLEILMLFKSSYSG